MRALVSLSTFTPAPVQNCTHTAVFCPQVEVEVESMDKAGNFIGWLHIDGANLSVLLVEQALSKVHFTAERSAYYKPLLSAEEAAKQRKEKVPSTGVC